MAVYIDGFVIPIPKKNVKAYVAMAKKASKVFLDHGALEFRECEGDEMGAEGMMPFPKLAGCKKGETVFFSYIVYKSKAHRKKVAAAVMKDPRIESMMCSKMPFDMARMAMGGFACRVQG